jgi:hypothetical protein
VLVDLLSPNFPPSHENTYSRYDTHERLDRVTGGSIPALLVSNDDKGCCVTSQTQKQDDVTVDAVKHEEFVAEDWRKLEHHENTCR